MLFGGKKIEDEILSVVYDFSRKHHITPIFGAMVGSVSRGVHMADSDYDTRFLFLRDDFPYICIPSEMDEKELHFRFYPDTTKIYEFIPFWEFTSFIQFVKEPRFKGEDISPSLYNLLGWTFYSPYVWDPYGIQNRIMPFMDLCFERKYSIIHHRCLIEDYLQDLCSERILVKHYVSCIHSAASIMWCILFNRRPPLNLQTLLLGVGKNDIWNYFHEIIESTRSMVHKEVEKYGQESSLFRLHFNADTTCDAGVVDYILSTYKKSEKYLEDKQEIDFDKCILGIYDIVSNTIEDKTVLEARD